MYRSPLLQSRIDICREGSHIIAPPELEQLQLDDHLGWTSASLGPHSTPRLLSGPSWVSLLADVGAAAFKLPRDLIQTDFKAKLWCELEHHTLKKRDRLLDSGLRCASGCDGISWLQDGQAL